MPSKKPGRVALPLLFADVKGYSKLKDHQVKTFVDEVLPRIAKAFEDHVPSYINTWGDAVFAICPTPWEAAQCGLKLCRIFLEENWTRYALPAELAIRVSLHFGEFHKTLNPITGREEYLGANINLAARIEPIVGSNQAWATERFVHAMETADKENIRPYFLGIRQLVKGHGEEKLYRLSRDQLSEQDLKSGSYFSNPSFKLRRIHHISLPVRDLKKSLAFYKNFLGLREAGDIEVSDPSLSRLNFKFPGAWLQLPEGQQIHLIQVTDQANEPVTFRNTDVFNFKDVHFAFVASSYEAMKRMIEEKSGVILPGPEDVDDQGYVVDPDGHIIEITGPNGPQRRDRPK